MRTVIGIATYKRPKYLERALESLYGQADDILIYDNEKEKKDYKANAKFIFLKNYTEPIYYFTCDDDIIYPPNYVKKTIQEIEDYQSIITYHGDILINKVKGKYPETERLHFGSKVSYPKVVDVAGTGLTAFRTDYFNPDNIYKSKYKNMVDQLFSYEAAKADKQIILVPHEKNMFISQPVPKEDTIWGKYGNKRKDQIVLANKILAIKNDKQV